MYILRACKAVALFSAGPAKLSLQSAACICEAAKTEAQQATRALLQNVIGCRVQPDNASCLDQTAPCSILDGKNGDRASAVSSKSVQAQIS